MANATNYVRARIDEKTKIRATAALEAMGLSVSDAIRMLMRRVVQEQRLPFDVKAPNAKSLEAIVELKAAKGKRYASVKPMMADLNEDT